jgi:hypothetical protein
MIKKEHKKRNRFHFHHHSVLKRESERSDFKTKNEKKKKMFSKVLSWFKTESELIFLKPPSFSTNTPNKIGEGINVSEKNTSIKTENGYRVAIADEPIDAKVDGKKMFCVRIDNATSDPRIMIGFTPMETFDSKKEAYFGNNGFTGCGLNLYNGNLYYPYYRISWTGELLFAEHTSHNIIDMKISSKSTEIIVILTISNNGTKKEIRFLCDGKESKTSDVSKFLKEDRLFPAICLYLVGQQVTTIPVEQTKARTPEIKKFIMECQGLQNDLPVEAQNILREIKLTEERNKQNEQARKDLLKQNEETMMNFFKQFEQQQQAKENEDEVRVETKKENTKEKKVKQVATKKTKKETKPKTKKATKKKEEPKKEKKTKAKK